MADWKEEKVFPEENLHEHQLLVYWRWALGIIEPLIYPLSEPSVPQYAKTDVVWGWSSERDEVHYF